MIIAQILIRFLHALANNVSLFMRIFMACRPSEAGEAYENVHYRSGDAARAHRYSARPCRLEHPLSNIAKYLWPEDILLDIEVASKGQLIDEIGLHMEREHSMPRASVATGLSRREQAGSTGLGEGIAIPHARVEDLSRIQLAYLRLKNPIPYDAPDGRPVSDVLVILVPKRATEEHLQILAEVSQIFADRQFREHLHSCRHALEVKSLFESRS